LLGTVQGEGRQGSAPLPVPVGRRLPRPAPVPRGRLHGRGCGTPANTAGAACNRAAPDCCDGLVCACDPADNDCSDAPWQDRAAAAAVCRTNQTPWASEITVRYPWRSRCVPVTWVAVDADGDGVGIRIETFPEHGFLTEYIISTGFGQFAASGLPTASGAVPVGRPSASGPVPPSGAAKVASGSAAVGAMMKKGCWPRNPDWDTRRTDICEDCITFYERGVDGTSPTSAFCADCPDIGSCCYGTARYVPFAETFTGFDSLTYVAIDTYGGVSEPATVSIEISEF
jgi:hypothetical protein